MDNIVSIRKKIIKKETEEEFHLNPCDLFVTGKIYEINSNSKVFHYLPFHEYLIVLFDDFISIFDIKKSVYENLAILKQFKISEIYNFFFNNNDINIKNIEKHSHNINNNNINKNLSKIKKEDLENSDKEIKNKIKNINYNNNNDTDFNLFMERNFNLIADEQTKELRFFHVSENTFDKNILFFIEFQNKEFLVFEISDIYTDIFDKPSNSKEKAEGKSERKSNQKENKVENSESNKALNLVSKKENSEKEKSFLNKKPTRNQNVNKNFKENSDEEQSENNFNLNKNNNNNNIKNDSYEEDSDFAVKKNKKKKAANYKAKKKPAKKSKKKSSDSESEFAIENAKAFEDSSNAEESLNEINNCNNNNINKNNEKLTNESNISKSFISSNNYESIRLILKLDKRSYFNYRNFYFYYFKENLKESKLEESLLFKENKIAFTSAADFNNDNNNNNNNKKEISFLTNTLSEFDFNSSLSVIEFEYEDELCNSKRIFSIIFRSEFNCLFINKAESSDNRFNEAIKNNKNNNNQEFQKPFVLFREYDFKILEYKIFKFIISNNKFFIFIVIINENNDVLIENYIFLLKKSELKINNIDQTCVYDNKNNNYDNNLLNRFNTNEIEFNYFVAHCENIIFSNYKLNPKEEFNRVFDPAVISEINLTSNIKNKSDKMQENILSLFITKMHKVYVYSIKINLAQLSYVTKNFSVTESFLQTNNFEDKNEFFNPSFRCCLAFKAFEDLQSQIKHTFVLNDFIYCFDVKGNYSFYFLSDLLNSLNSVASDKVCEIKGLKSLSLTREVFAIAPFITEKGFFILNSYNILKNQDFSINYFIPLNLQVVPNFILNNNELKNFITKNKSLFNNNNNNLTNEKTFNLPNNCYNLISEYLIRKLRLPAANNDLFDFLSKNIEKELIFLSDFSEAAALRISDEKKERKENNLNLSLLKLRIDYFLNKLKYKDNLYDDYKVEKTIQAVLTKFIKEENIIFNKNKNYDKENKEKKNFKTVCEICNDTDLVYNIEEMGYICKNDHFFPCCCITRYPLICLGEKGEIINNSFFKCSFCDIFYEAEKNEFVKKYKTCIVCMNYLIKF